MSSSPGPATRPADGAVVGAAVRTLDDERPSATALAWRDGELVAVATTPTSARTSVHAPWCARRRLSTPLWDVATLLRCLDHLGSAAARRDIEVAPDAWIEAASTPALDAYCARSPVRVDRELEAA
jgi:hypothetical protein